MKRGAKKTVILLVYLAILISLGLLAYWMTRPKPSCSDGVMNDGETGVDCGGPCASCPEKIVVSDLQIGKIDIVNGGQDKYDILFEIKNPNSNFGNYRFEYNVVLNDDQGQTILNRKGRNYILPGEKKHVIEANFEASQKPANVSVEIVSNTWEKINVFEEPALYIYNKRFNSRNDNGNSEVYGLLRNESNFDFNVVDIGIILRNAQGVPVAVNKTDMRSILSQQERDFKLVWPYEIKDDVITVEVEAKTNVFDSENFRRSYPSTQSF